MSGWMAAGHGCVSEQPLPPLQQGQQPQQQQQQEQQVYRGRELAGADSEGSWENPLKLLLLQDHNHQSPIQLSPSELLEMQRQLMYNWSLQASDPEFDHLRQPAWRGFVIALYISIILVGTIGNTVVVFVVVKNKSMHSVTNIFIANLALSDIGLCIFSLPVQLYYQLTDHWVFGESLCRMTFAAFAVPMYVSTLTILLIAFDRYWLIVYPLRERMPLRLALLLILAVSVTSALLAVPVICFTKLHTWNDTDLRVFRHYCVEEWPSVEGRMVYSISMFLLQFCTPLIATTLLYYRIYCRLKHRTSHRVVRHHDRKQKTNKLLVAIVTLFIICWLPWTLYSLVTEINFQVVKGPHFKLIDVMLRAFAMGSACVNPFLYCWLNENFRKELDNFAARLHIYRQTSVPCRTSPGGRQGRGDEEHCSNNGSARNGLLVIPAQPVTRDGLSTSRLSTTHTHLELTSIQRDGPSTSEASSTVQQ